MDVWLVPIYHPFHGLHFNMWKMVFGYKSVAS